MSDTRVAPPAAEEPDPTAEELLRYRQQAREWLQENMSWLAGWQGTTLSEQDRMALARSVQSAIYTAGYAGISAPVEYGGQGMHPSYAEVFEDESGAFDLPTRLIGVSLSIVVPTLLRFGSERQNTKYLPQLLSGDKVGIQLLSEPSSGSDLASLLTRAERDGAGFVLNGQKCWSSGAEYADYALCPARTDWNAPKHRGISVFLVDLSSPGIEIRPIRQIDGATDFCEEFLTDVAVDADDIIGAENDGWHVVRGLLEIEHAWAGRHGTGRRAPGTVDHLIALARQTQDEAVDIADRRSIAALHVDIRVHELLTTRIRHRIASEKVNPGYGSLLKVSSDNLVQRRAELGLALAGPTGLAWAAGDSERGSWSHAYLNSRSASIAGGTREIQRNRVAESVLQLPRDPDPYRDVPFAEAPHN